MSVWFEGSSEIECNIQQIKHSIENLGEFYVGVIGLMPGLTNVELEEQGNDSVIIRTNEGLMKRTDITKIIDNENVILEYDEDYQAGSRVNTKSHFIDRFTASGSNVSYSTTISDVTAPGLLGFFYRKFGSANTGNAFLNAYKTFFENQNQ